jgi:hypothetical protein
MASRKYGIAAGSPKCARPRPAPSLLRGELALKRTIDPGLQAIAELEANIIAAHDQKATQGVSATELQQQRPEVVRLAATIAERLRREYVAGKRTL